MDCPRCGHEETEVLWTRNRPCVIQGKPAKRYQRRRICENCEARFTTTETALLNSVTEGRSTGSSQAIGIAKKQAT